MIPVDKPLVSILVCVYNTESFLPRCIDSILAQTYSNIEVVLVDDGSTDRSGTIIDEYAKKDARIVTVHQENKGFSGCRNACLDYANGDFFAFVDSDDSIASDFVEYMLDVQRQTHSDLVVSTNCFTSVNLHQIEDDEIMTWSSDKAVSEFFYPRIPLGSWNKLYRKRFIDEHGFRFIPELSTGEGLQFITAVANSASCVGVGRRKVYFYSLNNPNSATTKADIEKQGIGSLKTMSYIEKNLCNNSNIVRRSMQWHRWSCYNYCLRQIINAKAKQRYGDLYKQCVRYLRTHALHVATLDLPLKHRCIAVISIFSPRLAAQIMIAKKNRQMSN